MKRVEARIATELPQIALDLASPPKRDPRSKGRSPSTSPLAAAHNNASPPARQRKDGAALHQSVSLPNLASTSPNVSSSNVNHDHQDHRQHHHHQTKSTVLPCKESPNPKRQPLSSPEQSPYHARSAGSSSLVATSHGKERDGRRRRHSGEGDGWRTESLSPVGQDKEYYSSLLKAVRILWPRLAAAYLVCSAHASRIFLFLDLILMHTRTFALQLGAGCDSGSPP